MIFRTETAIVNSMVEEAIRRGLIDPSDDVLARLEEGLDTENQYILDLSTHAYQLADLEMLVQNAYLDVDIDTSTGEGLETLGKLFNIQRVQPQSSIVEITVTLTSPADNDIVIPKGTHCRFVPVKTNSSAYVTRDEATINAGVTSINIICESVQQDYLPILEAGAINGLEGYNDFSVTNNAPSTTGRPVELDTDYRNRIKSWVTRNIKGTEDCIRDYLDHYDGLDGYVLIPLFDGENEGVVGALTVVCDTLESQLPLISEGLKNNCMILTDFKPNCIQPTNKYLQDITVTVKRSRTEGAISNDELAELIIAQTKAYIQGGITRYGMQMRGVQIGQPLNPSKLLGFLVDEFLECDNIKLSEQSTITVEPTEKLRINTVEVVFE